MKLRVSAAGKPRAVQLDSEQVMAAVRLWERLDDFRRSDRALFALQGCFPGFDSESTLLKVLALSSVDAAKGSSGVSLANRVQILLSHADVARCGPELVDALAATAVEFGKQSTGGLGFASRFAHFFVDGERFPILDAWSERALEWLIEGPIQGAPGESRYARFARDFAWIASALRLTRRRELGHWLWIAGQYRAWTRNRRTPMHRSVRALFESGPPELGQLLPVAAPQPLALQESQPATPSLESQALKGPPAALPRPRIAPARDVEPPGPRGFVRRPA